MVCMPFTLPAGKCVLTTGWSGPGDAESLSPTEDASRLRSTD